LDVLRVPTAATVLEEFGKKVVKQEMFDSSHVKSIMKEIQKEQGIKGPALWKPVRVALTGSISGPELPLVIDIFGREKVLDFVKQALQKHLTIKN